ncbi:hypothetical protein LINPERPRIM_LOCUS33382 [Linum perenne]
MLISTSTAEGYFRRLGFVDFPIPNRDLTVRWEMSSEGPCPEDLVQFLLFKAS